MAVAFEQHVQLAQRLHPRLLAFFKRFPPQRISINESPSTQTISISENTSSYDPNVAAATIEVSLDSTETVAVPSTPSEMTHSKRHHNPFLPFKNPRTGTWHGPVFSLRRQAELFKLAAQYNVLPLMPTSHKHPEVREQKRIDHGLQVRGTGVGKRVKGKAWERMLPGRLREMEKAMEGMPEMIRSWKEKGHGRGWKKWPK